ncbi:acetyltransferase complex ard1 subunit [Entamoeba marina]
MNYKIHLNVHYSTCVTGADIVRLESSQLTSIEEYQIKFYYYHFLSWPYLSYLAELPNGNIIGYVLLKMEENPDKLFASLTTLTVARPYRRMKVATTLLKTAENALIEAYGAQSVISQVPTNNKAIIETLKKCDYIGNQNTGDTKIYLQHQLNSKSLMDPTDDSPFLKTWKQSIAKNN